MFGDKLATTTTFWGETSLVCLLPPATQPGAVHVTFKHQYHQQPQYPTPPGPKLTTFTYVDDEDSQLYAAAIRALCGKETGTPENIRNYARRIVNSQKEPSTLAEGTPDQVNSDRISDSL